MEMETKHTDWRLNLPRDPRSRDPNVLRTLPRKKFYFLERQKTCPYTGGALREDEQHQPQSLSSVLIEMVFKASCLDTLLLLLTKTICRNLMMVPRKGLFLFSSLTMAEHKPVNNPEFKDGYVRSNNQDGTRY
jgi:hypothetical protein